MGQKMLLVHQEGIAMLMQIYIYIYMFLLDKNNSGEFKGQEKVQSMSNSSYRTLKDYKIIP